LDEFGGRHCRDFSLHRRDGSFDSEKLQKAFRVFSKLVLRRERQYFYCNTEDQISS
jgi:hypothetical protein